MTIDPIATMLTQLQNKIGAASKEDRPTDVVKKAMLLRYLSEDYETIVTILKLAGMSTLS